MNEKIRSSSLYLQSTGHKLLALDQALKLALYKVMKNTKAVIGKELLRKEIAKSETLIKINILYDSGITLEYNVWKIEESSDWNIEVNMLDELV